jgi:hypothetical protein
MNSSELIGKVHERWAELGNEDPDRVDERYGGDPWRLFYTGWIEGRADMLVHTARSAMVRRDVMAGMFILGLLAGFWIGFYFAK